MKLIILIILIISVSCKDAKTEDEKMIEWHKHQIELNKVNNLNK